MVEDPEDTLARSARAEFLVTIDPPSWILPLVITLLAIGAFFTGVSENMVKEITRTGEHAVVIGYVVKGFGTVLVGIGGYLGFRKLPSAAGGR